MTDYDMTIHNNPNLGKSHLPFLDEIEAQNKENENARREGREPRTIVSRERHGAYASTVTNGPLVFDNGDPCFHDRDLKDYPEPDHTVVPPVEEINPPVEEINSNDEDDAENIINKIMSGEE